jgi:two-component system sensor histidine kinase QseC
MSLRLRLLLMIGIALSLLWGGVAVWMQRGLDHRMQRSLDQRLEMSAEMVAGLMANSVGSVPALTEGDLPMPQLLAIPAAGIGSACEVRSVRGRVFARTPGISPAVLAANTPGFSLRTIDGHLWRTYTLASHGLLVTTADRMDERNLLLGDVMLAAVLPFAVALLGGLIVLWFGISRGLMPFERLRQALAGREASTLAPLQEIAMPAELQPFVTTLNDLLARIQATINRERRFTSDAAHELRTPLTAVKIHLQVMRISQGEDARIAMAHMEEGVTRMQRMMEQLLTLARVEGDCPCEEKEVAPAGEVAFLAARDSAPGRPDLIEVRGNQDGHASTLEIPQALAVTALRNLLDNAQRHSPPGATVTLDVQLQDGGVCFRVCDNGPGMTAEELGMASERFWRRDAGPGSGLGLSIVQAIAERFRGSLALSARQGGGLEACLYLPARPA